MILSWIGQTRLNLDTHSNTTCVGISESEERREGRKEGRQQRASPEFGGREEKVEEGRFLTLLPLEVVLERVTPLKERGGFQI